MLSRFATSEEVFNEEFWTINKKLIELNKEFGLYDHSKINEQRCDWVRQVDMIPALYASRMWEYPFAILAAELKNGMTCADIGCGTSPFTAFLSQMVGSQNVVGFDPDYLKDDEADTHSMFGMRQSFIDNVGFKYKENDMCNLDCSDESFDRVFCISVIEHIHDETVWHKGLREMVRILKPGGRLILTVDLGVGLPLTNPLELIKVSGLAAAGYIDINWPEERFINLNGQGMDVFGLVLVKSQKKIFINRTTQEKMDEYHAFDKYVPQPLSISGKQIAKDFDTPFGKLKVLSKLLLGKYRC